MNGTGSRRTPVSRHAALEESLFLGLRLTRGVSVGQLAAKFGDGAVGAARAAIVGFIEDGLMEPAGDFVRLTERGRLLSNEVFERFLADEIVR